MPVTITLTAWIQYELGVTIAQTIDMFSYHRRAKLTPGGRRDAGICALLRQLTLQKR